MPTANDLIRPRHLLGEIHTLQANLDRLLTTGEELTKSRNTRVQETRREHARHEEAENARNAARIHMLQQQHRHAIELANARRTTRETLIESAYQAARKTLAQKLQEKKDRRIGSLQGTIFVNRQTRKRQLARATDQHRKFKAQLAADRETRNELRDSALKSMRSFQLLLKPLFYGGEIQLAAEAAAMSADELHAESREHLEALRTQVASIDKQPLTRLFRWVPLSALLTLTATAFASHAWLKGYPLATSTTPLLLALGAITLVWLQALTLAFFSARNAARTFTTTRTLANAAEQASANHLAKLNQEYDREQQVLGQDLSNTFHDSSSEWQAEMRQGQRELDAKRAKLPARLERVHQQKLRRLEQAHQIAVQHAEQEINRAATHRRQSLDHLTRQADADLTTAIHALTPAWQEAVLAPISTLANLLPQSQQLAPPLTRETCTSWSPPDSTPPAVRIGTLNVDLTELAGRTPTDPRLALPDPPALTVPFALGFPEQGSLLIETTDDPAPGSAALANIALRILASMPPGRASFVFIDPVGLGRDFAGLMHLADHEESLITHRIWTQPTQIEERLAELNEHIEKVIQMYLRNEYETIEEYNDQAGVIAEKYRFLVIANFPSAFSETATKRLLAIASSGPRCGVHLLIHRDARLPSPDPALDAELRRTCLRMTPTPSGWLLPDRPQGTRSATLEPPPNDADAVTLVHRIGRASVDSNRVEVPFSHIAPPPNARWSTTTADELRVPIGRTGAKKLQMLAIGKGTRQHMLVAGKTGSGKSTLFHVIITNLALWCRPDEVEFYLVDFKKGVEFKCYAAKQLPHARVVAIESDREFALSVLQRVDHELKRRGELFRKAGSQDVAGYRSTPNAEPLPRTLLLIDEFQEFFTEDDATAQEASLLLDRIVRQGRAFGIHVILGSQTLGGAYTLARATLGQMVIRVALQCNETDAHLIMDDDNPAPRLLTRPGEGIYNDQAGALAANSPFQIVWLPEAERDALLDEVAQLARQSTLPFQTPIVFEGNAPAEVADNPELTAAIASHPATRPTSARAWLGAPNSIKGPTAATFQRQSGSHLLVVCQSAERTLSLLTVSLLSLAAQYPPNAARFVILDPSGPESQAHALLAHLAASLPHPTSLVPPAEVPSALAELAASLDARSHNASDEPEIFLIIHDLQRFKALRPDDDFRFALDDDASAPNPSQVLANALSEGGPAGVHVIATIDTWNNVSRWIPRKLLGEFEMRVLFQMSANDSANLIDSPAASTLGMHRALFHNEHYGTAETFRPYAMPDTTWLEATATTLTQR